MDFSRERITLEPFGSLLSSPVISEDKPFNMVGIQFDEIIQGLMVNFDPFGGGVWEPVVVHDDGFGAETLLFTSPTRSIQFRTSDISQPFSFNADFFFIPVEDSGTENQYGGPQIAVADLNIISRKSWGADENLRYWSPEIEELFEYSGNDKEFTDPCGDMNTQYSSETQLSRVVKLGPRGEQLVWPLAYSKNLSKIVIHHTDSDLRDMNGDRRMDNLDYKAVVRAIYYFHAITRGWGDIGYNYIIDPLGNVYEGRYGGDRVVGAHAQCYNNGSLGISIIGDYEDNNVPEPAMNALISLIAKKSKQYGISPTGNSSFRGKILPNIIGHRDVRPTSCPGKKLYALLPKIRIRSDLLMRTGAFNETSLSTQTLDYNAESIDSPPTISLLPNERKKIKLQFKNTGKKAWDSNTWLHVSLNNQGGARLVPIIEGKDFVAGDMKENRVSPGGTATFEVEVESGYLAGYHSFEVAPVVNGRYKVSRSAVYIPIQIETPRFDYKVVKKNLPSGIVFQGQNIQASIILQNTSNIKWVNYGDHPIRLGTDDLRDHRTLLVKQHATRLAHLLESEVLPGQTGTFLFDLDVPLNFEGRITERFTPVIEYVNWFEDKGLGFEIIVRKPRHMASISDKTIVRTMIPGEMKKINLTLQNKGDLAWNRENMKITVSDRGLQAFKRFLYPLDEIKPGTKGNFSFWVQAPYEEGPHRVFLSSRFNNLPILGGTARFIVNVPEPKLRARIVTQSDRNITLHPGEEVELEAQFKNISNVVWRKKGSNAIYLAPARPQDRLSDLKNSDWPSDYRAGVLVEDVVYPGETGTFRFKVKPNRTGTYHEYFQLVIERVGWIDASFVRWDFTVTGDRVKRSETTSVKIVPVVKTVVTSPIKEVADPTPIPDNVVISEKIVPPVQDHPFRVRLSYGDNNSKVTANRDFSITDGDGLVLFQVNSGQSVELRRVYNNIHVQFGNVAKNSSVIRIVPDVDGIVEILTMNRRPSWNTNLNDNRFRGVLEVRPVNGETAYINELPLEDYLKGLAEVSNGELPEKQKAIAVLARTYARFYMSDNNRKFPGLPYDGSDDPAIFQRYLGYGVETRSPNFVSAVSKTCDQVVTYQGKLIKTPYFNQSAGRTLSANEVWGWVDTPYLQSVKDPYCEGLVKNGHGVGMSGCGSEGMAKAGKTYEEIIKYYYQGVGVERLDF